VKQRVHFGIDAGGGLLRRVLSLLGLLLALPATAQAPAAPAAAAAQPVQRLRVVGGLASVNQYTRHEAPFWTTQLPRLSGGRYSAEIVPFDRAGIRGQEMLSMVKLGTVPFGTLLLGQSSPRDLELGAPDLAGLSPDMPTLRRVVAAFRPHLQQLLRERHGAELLALYTYPAQVLFCTQPIQGLASIKGRRVRIANPSQGDWVEALGAKPISIAFADILPSVRSANVDCAITGTMSGNTIGLHDITTHLHGMAISWGLSVFVAHSATWQALPEDLKALIRRELPRVEADVWDESARESDEGVACNVGAPACQSGRRGRMVLVPATAEDERRRREILADTVLPRWLQRCGPGCAELWNRTLAPATGVEARLR
jgi:TRAP-type C4-dicarboxylate transport system substrate-binding protein